MINNKKSKNVILGIIFSTFIGTTIFMPSIENNLLKMCSSITIHKTIQSINSNSPIYSLIKNNTISSLASEAFFKSLGKYSNKNETFINKKSSSDATEPIDIDEIDEATEATDNNDIIVSNVNELYSALGSNKHIKLEPGVYNLSELDQTSNINENIYWKNVFDGNQLVFNGITNLSFEGIGDNYVEIVVEPRYANVLSFINCENISFKNIKAGHTIKKGYCVGGVLNFDSTKKIDINNCLFYGCGTYGLTTKSTEDLNFDNSIIEECTYGIMQIKSSSNFTFKNSSMRNCKEFDMINIDSSQNIIFDSCKISDNITNNTWWNFLTIKNSNNISFTNSEFKNNAAVNFLKSDSSIDFTNSVFKDNSFNPPIVK